MGRLKANAEYRRMFAAAFPGEREPMTYENLGRAIGAFERKLVTPSRWDHFLHGVDSALTPAEKEGFNTFTATGCQTCHSGAYVGGTMYQKAGLVRPWPDTADVGREAITHQAGRPDGLQGAVAAEHRAHGAVLPQRRGPLARHRRGVDGAAPAGQGHSRPSRSDRSWRGWAA